MMYSLQCTLCDVSICNKSFNHIWYVQVAFVVLLFIEFPPLLKLP